MARKLTTHKLHADAALLSGVLLRASLSHVVSLHECYAYQGEGNSGILAGSSLSQKFSFALSIISKYFFMTLRNS